jgi:uncharacterized protein
MPLRPAILGPVLGLLLGFVALPAAALCDGPSLLDRLSGAERAALDERVAATPFSEGLLWTARRDDKTLTIAGTIHIYDERLEAIAAQLEDAITGADLLMLEMTPSQEEEMQQLLLAEPDRVFITEGPTLPELLDEDTWAAVVDALRARNIPPFLAAKFQPWYLMISLAMPGCAMPEMVSGRRGLDHMVMDRAIAADVPLQALEPWDTLFTILDAGHIEEQIALLRMSLMAPELQEEMFVALVDGYFEERIGEVWELSRISADFVPGLDRAEADRALELSQDLLLVQRNRDWIPVIEDAAERHDRIVVAAGAAHLPGEDGILSLLRARGWSIDPIALVAPEGAAASP